MSIWSTATPDWQARLLAGRSLVPDLPLFRPEAERALRIFKRLRMPDVIGCPTMAEACGPWFFPVVEALFGSYDPTTNRRLIQEYFQLIPKKNSKSSNGGAVMLVALLVNERPLAEFLLIAPTKEIADISFKQAKGTIKVDPKLEKLFQIQDHIRKITHRLTGATLQVKAADTDVITGGKATGTLIDETHVFAKRPRAADVFVELRGALTARPDGFLFQITTQSKEAPSGVFKAELDMARKVRDGLIDFPLLPILYELPHELTEKGGWKNKELWPLVNPNMGRSVNMDFLARELVAAEEKGPQQLALFASQHFNIEIGLALLSDGWAGAEYWLGNEKAGLSNVDATLTLEALLQRSEVVVVGIDGGGLDDLLGLAVMGREAVTGKLLLWTHAWAHEIVKSRRKEIAPKLEDLAQLKQLTFVDVPGEDVQAVAEIVFDIERRGLLAEKDAVGVDSFGVADIVKALTGTDDGLEAIEDEAADSDDDVRFIDKDRIVGVPQGWQLNGAIKTAERNLAGGTLIHDGSQLMTWVVGNARVEPKGSAITITKQVSGSAKIDPLIAVFNALVLIGRNPTARGVSVYDRLAAGESDADASEDEPTERIDPAILADPKHPRWREMRDRYHALLDRDNEEFI